VVYHGELGDSCSSLVSYFESRGAPMIEIGENAADWMLRVMALERMGDMADVFLKSDEFRLLKEELDEIKENPVADQEIKYESVFAVSANARQDAVNRRLRTIYWRSPTYNTVRVSVSAVIAFILGSVFIFDWDQDSFTEIQMRARLSVIFLSFIIIGIMAIISTLPVMTMIRDMYYRHHDAGMYGSIAMGAALGVAEKWFLVISSAIFTFVFLATSHINGGQFSFGFWVSIAVRLIRKSIVTGIHRTHLNGYLISLCATGVLHVQPCHLFIHWASFRLPRETQTDGVHSGECLHWTQQFLFRLNCTPTVHTWYSLCLALCYYTRTLRLRGTGCLTL
jgi:hypothetical protein